MWCHICFERKRRYYSTTNRIFFQRHSCGHHYRHAWFDFTMKIIAKNGNFCFQSFGTWNLSLFFLLIIERNSSIPICHYLLTNFIYRISCILCNIVIFWGRNRFLNLKNVYLLFTWKIIHLLCSAPLWKKDEISHTHRGFGLWCLMPLSTISQLYRGGHFIGGEKNRPVASHWLTLSQMLYRVHLTWAGLELTMLVVTGTDCIGSYKCNLHTITLMTAPHSLEISWTYVAAYYSFLNVAFNCIWWRLFHMIVSFYGVDCQMELSYKRYILILLIFFFLQVRWTRQ